MASLQFVPTHNMVAFLLKPKEAQDFVEIVDFLKQSNINHALTVNPTVYISHIQQFWSSAKIKIVNDEVQIHAKVEGKKVIITEASVRRHLHLADANGIDCLPDATIFETLKLMGYEGPTDKFTFYKALFSPQWKFLIHTLSQCLSPKTTGWNEFSSAIASAIICLATDQKFNFSKMIFDGMVRNLDAKSAKKFLMYPRFVQVFLNKEISDISTPNESFICAAHTKKVFSNMRRKNDGFSGKVTPLFSTMVNVESTPGEGSGTPTDSHHTPSTSHPRAHTKPKQGSKIKERKGIQIPAADEATQLSKKVAELELIQTSQQFQIQKLQKWVKKLLKKEKKRKSKVHLLRKIHKSGSSKQRTVSPTSVDNLQEDASKQGGIVYTDQVIKGIVDSVVVEESSVEREDAFDDLNLIDVTVQEVDFVVDETDAENVVQKDDVVRVEDEMVLAAETIVSVAADAVSTFSIVSAGESVKVKPTVRVFDNNDEEVTLAQELIKVKESVVLPKLKGVIISEQQSEAVMSAPTIDPKEKGKAALIQLSRQKRKQTPTKKSVAKGVSFKEPLSQKRKMLSDVKGKGKGKASEEEKDSDSEDEFQFSSIAEQVAYDEKMAKQIEQEEVERVEKEKAAYLEMTENEKKRKDAESKALAEKELEEKARYETYYAIKKGVEEFSSIDELLERKKKALYDRCSDKNMKPMNKAQLKDYMITVVSNCTGKTRKAVRNWSYANLEKVYISQKKMMDNMVDFRRDLAIKQTVDISEEDIESLKIRNKEFEVHLDLTDEELLDRQFAKAEEPLIDRDLFQLTKGVIWGWETYEENGLWKIKIIRMGNKATVFESFDQLLTTLDRIDLEAIYSLGKMYFAQKEPTGFGKKILWANLLMMYDPFHVDLGNFWKKLNADVQSWRLFSTIRVHSVVLKNGFIVYMFAEKAYPITYELRFAMMKTPLQVDMKGKEGIELMKEVLSQMTDMLKKQVNF